MAAKTLSAIRETVRQFLRDEFVEGSDYEFEDDEIDLHIAEILTEISERRPYEVRETKVSDGTKEVDISSITDLLEVEKAEYPTGNDPPCYRNVSVFGNTLRLDIDSDPTSGDNIYLYCHKVHQLTESSSTLSPDLERTLIEGAVSKTALAFLNKMRNQVVPSTYQWYQNWANNQLLLYRNSLGSITRPKVWEFYSRY